VKRGCDLALELEERGVHSAKLRYTAGGDAGQFSLPRLFNFVRGFFTEGQPAPFWRL
jgi:hypothetical protein